MTRRSLWMSFAIVVLSQLSAGCCTTWRPAFWRCNGCQPASLTPPGAGTSFSPGPLLARPLLPRPWLHAGVPMDAGVGGMPMGEMPMDGGPGCASCFSSPGTVPVPPGGPVNAFTQPGNVITTAVPTLNYGPQPAGFSTQPPTYFGAPSTPLPQPKVYPMTGAESPTPMPGQK